LEWVRGRPVAAVLLLVGTVAALVLVVALALRPGKGKDSGPLRKKGNPFLERRTPGPPKEPP
jgi:hypothetical protein